MAAKASSRKLLARHGVIPLRKMVRYPELKDAGVVNNRVTLQNIIKNDGFPPPVKIGGWACAWFQDEVEAYLERKRLANRGRPTEHARAEA
jgi:hypothetical protein